MKTSPTDLLESLQARGVEFRLDGDRLRFRAPAATGWRWSIPAVFPDPEHGCT